MKNETKLFLYKLALVIAILIVVDIVGGLALKAFFNKQKSGKYFKVSHAISNSKEDILIFGNSHAAEHFDAPLMQKLTLQTVYNFGNGGQSILYNYPVLKSVLYHHTPKLVILNVDYEELAYYPESYQRISILLPYFASNSVIDSAIALMPFNETLKCRSALYRYNSTLGNTVLNTYFGRYTRLSELNGYEPKLGSVCRINVSDESEAKEKITFDQNKINYLLRFIDAVNSRNIKLLVTSSPLYNYPPGKNRVYKQKLKSILAKYKIPYLDYGSDAAFYGHCEYFNDKTHLNPAGASKLTEVISKVIRGG